MKKSDLDFEIICDTSQIEKALKRVTKAINELNKATININVEMKKLTFWNKLRMKMEALINWGKK